MMARAPDRAAWVATHAARRVRSRRRRAAWLGLALGLVHRTARLDRGGWARCARRACTAPPCSVWPCPLCAAHRGSRRRRRSQHAARTRPAVSGTGHRHGCSTCGRLLVEQRRGPTSMVTQVLATVSAPVFRPLRFGGQALRRVWSPSGRMPLAARHCAGRRVAGAGRVVKPSRCAGKGWAFLARTSLSAARSCAVHSTKAVLARSRPRTQRRRKFGGRVDR